MATTVETVSEEEEEEIGGYETEDWSTDEGEGDSEGEDPTFSVLEETRSSFSRLSLKKTRPRVSAKKVVGSEKDTEGAEMEVPVDDDKDGKCIEKVERMVKDGQVEKLKVDQCKVYLKKYGLRMTGNKNVLIARIKEHLQVLDGGGEKMYPETSFLINCKGDVLMFEQKVYDMFNIASRSATGPPLGTRIVAGRVVKESYGAAKQQHTFTIEVLWSRGEKPLPPLYPLLIKGRNLYRLKTVRQKWVDELERSRVLQEKHTRGGVARYCRDIRVRDKETKKINRGRRLNSGVLPHGQGVQLQHNAKLAQPQLPVIIQGVQHQQNSVRAQAQRPVNIHQKHHHQHNNETLRSNQYENYPNCNAQGVATQEQNCCVPQATVEKNQSMHYQNRPNCTVQGVPAVRTANHEQHDSVSRAVYMRPSDSQFSYNPSPNRQPFRDMNTSLQSREVELQVKYPLVDNYSSFPHSPKQWNGGGNATTYSNGRMSPRNRFNVREPISNFNYQPQSLLTQPPSAARTPNFYDDDFDNRATANPWRRPQIISKLCTYHLQGRCNYRENCRFLHQ